MKKKLTATTLMAFIAAMLVAACDGSSFSGTASYSLSSSSSSASSAASATSISLSGSTGRAALAGDVVELTDGEVTVNGVSHGQVANGEEVVYASTEQGKVLTVGGVVRSPVR